MKSFSPSFFPIVKIEDEQRIVKGPVLRPEVRDRHKTIMSADVIREAAHKFMARLNAPENSTKSGLMHTDFTRKLVVVESWVTDRELSFAKDERISKKLLEEETIKVVDMHKDAGGVWVQKLADSAEETTEEVVEMIVIPAGTWMMAMKVYDDTVWEGVKNGTFKGFSVGGKAQVQYGDN